MSVIDTLIRPRERDLGGFSVHRVLPGGPRQMVGPFIFFDAMGPATFAPDTGVDVRPHPHIGLATVTWLFEGELLHRDSLGFTQVIRPGEVNWMTAGSGIVHSERTPPENRRRPSRLHGIQSWVALPKHAEETAPEFHHHAAGDLPALDADGVRLRVIAGTLLGLTSPVRTFSAMGYGALELATGARCQLPAEHEERAVYLVDGELAIDGESVPAGACAILLPGRTVELLATAPSRCMVLGGEPADGPRHIWWNFVSSSAARLEQARRDWKLGRFTPVPGESEFIPLPEY
ncbi:MAG: pirin family protein [Gammaproteobacteria bacterium]